MSDEIYLDFKKGFAVGVIVGFIVGAIFIYEWLPPKNEIVFHKTTWEERFSAEIFKYSPDLNLDMGNIETFYYKDYMGHDYMIFYRFYNQWFLWRFAKLE